MPRHGVVFEGREDKLQEVARQIPHADKKAVRVGKRCYWSLLQNCGVGEDLEGKGLT